MSFYTFLHSRTWDWERLWAQCDASAVERALSRTRLEEEDFLALLSPAAVPYLEAMAQRARRLTWQNFGRVQVLYTPLYLANYCVNHCRYCGFRTPNPIPRRQLTLAEVEAEARLIAATGLRHILILTGEDRRRSNLDYIKDCVRLLRRYFTSVGIEIYPLETEEYRELVEMGVDGLTIFQEVYDETLYAEFHPRGPKRNYRFRLEAPERGGEAGMRTVNIGALLGLGPWRQEAFFTGLHASYLQDRYPASEISISPPRLRPEVGGYTPPHPVGDRELVQIILAWRLFLPRVGITLSTRERPALRDRLIHLGVTKISAGSCTAVGGRLAEAGISVGSTGAGEETAAVGQFELADHRSVGEIRAMLAAAGYQAVSQDWV